MAKKKLSIKDIRNAVKILQKHQLPKLPCGCQVDMDSKPHIILTCEKHSDDLIENESYGGTI